MLNVVILISQFHTRKVDCIWAHTCTLTSTGADITDYFNYGFTEETWKLYNDKQRRVRAEVQQLNKIAVSFVQDKPAWSEYWYRSCRTHDCCRPRASRSPRMLFVALVSLHCVNVCCRVRIFGNAWFIELTHVNNTVHHLMSSDRLLFTWSSASSQQVSWQYTAEAITINNKQSKGLHFLFRYWMQPSDWLDHSQILSVLSSQGKAPTVTGKTDYIAFVGCVVDSVHVYALILGSATS